MNDIGSQIKGENYINLETYRRSGIAVQTPVWFVVNNYSIYVRTIENSGKVKRIRNNPRVRIVPCEVNGYPKGEWISGIARIANANEMAQVDKLLDEKYGALKRQFEQKTLSQGFKYTVIAISF
jgi:hypothetical protein